MNRQFAFVLFSLVFLLGFSFAAITVSGCQVIATPGEYEMNQTISGANISRGPGTWACIVLNSSDIDFSCNGSALTNNGTSNAVGIFINGSTSVNHTNVTIRDCSSIAYYQVGTSVRYSAEDTIRNVSVDSNDVGINVWRSAYCTVENNTATNSTWRGFSLATGSFFNITNNTAFGNIGEGFEFQWVSNCIIRNNLAEGSTTEHGFLFQSDIFDNTIVNNTARNNTLQGFYLDDLYYNDFINNTAFNNSGSGIYFHWSGGSGSHNNTFSGNNASNNTLYGFHFNRNAGDGNITHNVAHDNSEHGFFLYWTINTVFINNTAFLNGKNGIMVDETGDSYDNLLINNTAFLNSWNGFYFTDTNYNNVTGNIAHSNTRSGFFFDLNSPYHLVINNTARDNSMYGFYINSSTNNTFINNTVFNNEYGLFVKAGANSINLSIDNMFFLGPDGSFAANYTNLSVEDLAGSGEEYSINWTPVATSPSKTFSFANKLINISTQAGTPSIDELTWHWLETELTGIFNESRFELWKYNSSGWDLLNNTPNTGANTLALYNLNPASDYGIFQEDISECMVINSPGHYGLNNNITGAPNAVSGIFGINWACIVFNTSDIVLDCNGYNITNDGTLDAAGLAVNGSAPSPHNNVTIKNCGAISQYEDGIFMQYSQSSWIENNTVLNGSYGMDINLCPNATIIDNTMRNNSIQGLSLQLQSSDTGTYLGDNVFYDNWLDLMVTASGPVIPTLFNMSNSTFRNPAGSLATGYTTLSILTPVRHVPFNGGPAHWELYAIDWSAQPAPLPSGFSSFNDKFVTIAVTSPTTMLQHVEWSWTAVEAAGHNEATFALWKHNATGWTSVAATLDTTTHTLSAVNLVPSSVYAILEERGGGNGGADEEPPDCETDEDCPDCYYCSIATGKCLLKAESQCGEYDPCPQVLIEGPMGGEPTIINYMCIGCQCVKVQCLEDVDCKDECLVCSAEGECVFRIDCATDSDCPDGYDCSNCACVKKEKEEEPEEEEEEEPLEEEEIIEVIEEEPPFPEPSKISEEVVPLIELAEEGEEAKEELWETIIKGVWILSFILILIAIIYVLSTKKKKRRPKA